MSDEQEITAPSQRDSRFLLLAMRALSVDALKWAIGLLAFSLYAAVAVRPHWIPLVGAGAFSLLGYLLVRKERRP